METYLQEDIETSGFEHIARDQAAFALWSASRLGPPPLYTVRHMIHGLSVIPRIFLIVLFICSIYYLCTLIPTLL